MVFGGALAFDERSPDRPDAFDRQDWRKLASRVTAASIAPLFITAGMQLAMPTGRVLPNGINPMYMLAAGGVFGSVWLSVPLANALED